MNNIETIYSLSPLQQGLLFHHLYDAAARVYHQQFRLRLRDYRAELGARAWALLSARHAVLRSGFEWEELDEALQLVYEQVSVPQTQLDWRAEAWDQERIDTRCEEERQRAFELSQAPLFRLLLIQLDEQCWELCWTWHHIILDGWSVGLILRDWLQLYQALAAGEEQPALAPVRPYQDYIAWWLEQDQHAAEAHFRPLLSPLQQATALPQLEVNAAFDDAGRGDHERWPYGELHGKLSTALTQRLSELGRQQQLTLASLCQAAWAMLLSQQAGAEQVCFGLTVSGRPQSLAASEEMVGLFINTLPMVLECASAEPLLAWLQALQEQASALQEYAYAPLAKLKALSAMRGEQALFDSIVVFESFPISASLEALPASLRLAPVPQDSATLRYGSGRNDFPLSLIIAPGASLELILSYQRARFSDAAAEQLLQRYQYLLERLAELLTQPAVQLGQWAATVSASSTAAVAAWEHGAALLNAGAEQRSDERSIVAWIQHWAAHPEQARQPAVCDRWHSLSYAELDQRSQAIAAALQAHGVGSGAVVALSFERQVEFIVALLAVLKLGACYLPLDLKQPPARLHELLQDSGARALIHQAQAAWQRVTLPATLQAWSWQDLAAQAAARPLSLEVPSAALAELPAYMIYTSGSTGKPKGVVLSQRALVAYGRSLLQLTEWRPGLRFGLVSTLAADLGHTQIFGALFSGGCLCLAEDEISFDPLALAAFFRTQELDVLKLTPSHLRGLLDAHEDPGLLPQRWLIFGGERLDRTLLQRVWQLRPALRVANHYGPTETCVGAVFQELDATALTARVIPLGYPMPGRCLRIVDAAGARVPLGVPGELWIGGHGLAEAYAGDPELTAARFITHQGQRFYRSGDRARWLRDGRVEFLGRMDEQIKLRGQRLEPGEVEAWIRKLVPAIRQVLVMLSTGEPQQLLAYVVASDAINGDKLRADLAKKLPEYMVPSQVISLDQFPLTANGKIDRRALPQAQTLAPQSAHFVAPRDALEEQLAAIWAQVLKRDAVGVMDDFFALGGDSILNLQIIARGQQQGLALTPRLLFERRTIAELAAALRSTDSAAALPVAAQTAVQVVPWSSAQRGLLAQHQSRPWPAQWRVLDLSAMALPAQAAVLIAQALHALQERHLSLRLGLQLTAQPTRAELLPQWRPARVQAAPPGYGLANAAALAEVALAQFDCAQGEVIGAFLLGEAGAWQLLLVAHPLVIDEASWPLLQEELQRALSQLCAGRPLDLGVRLGDWQAWLALEQELAQEAALEPLWEQFLELGDAVVPAALSSIGAVTPAEHTRAQTRLSAEFDGARIDRLCQRHALSPGEVLTRALRDWIGQSSAAEAAPEVLLWRQSERPAQGRWQAAGINFQPAKIIGCVSIPALSRLSCAGATAAVHQADDQLLRYLSANEYLLPSLLGLAVAPLEVIERGDWDQALPVLAAATPALSHAGLRFTLWRQHGDWQLAIDGPQAAQVLAQLEALLQRQWQRLEQTAGLPQAAFSQLNPSDHAAAWAALNALGVGADDLEACYPLTPMQAGMLLHTQLQPHSGIYLMQQRFRWQGPLQRKALDQAWQLLSQRHPILRTGFVQGSEGQAWQWVRRPWPVHCDWYDWRELSQTQQQAQLDEVLAAERQHGMSMSQAALSRLRVFQLGDGEYCLVRSFHHIISDAWCLGLLMQELFTLYQRLLAQQGTAQGGADPCWVLPPVRPFADYLDWLARQDQAAALGFWQEQLAGLSAPTPLMLGREARPGELETAGSAEVDEVFCQLSVSQGQRLEQLCRTHQLTPNTLLQGAWALLLARYSGGADVLFGVTVAGRPTALHGVEQMMGIFINSLPLRVSVTDEQELLPWLQQLLARNVALRDYEFTPLSEIQRCSELAPGQGLFDSLMVFENAPLDSSQIAVEDIHIDIIADRVHTNFPITMVIYPGDRLGLRLSYDAQRFTRSSMQRMLQHWRQLLLQMLEQPEQRLGQLDLLEPTERQQLIRDWSGEAIPGAEQFPLDQTYSQLFAQQAAQNPERIVAVHNGARLNYQELLHRSQALAQVLVEHGVGADDLVAIYAPRGLAFLTGVIACFHAGGAYLPLATQQPTARLAQLLSLSGARQLLVSAELLDAAQELLAQVEQPPRLIVIEEHWLKPAPAIPLLDRNQPDSLAYVLFTSGSTGTPKGVMVEQRGMLNNIYGKVPSLGLGEHDRIAQTASVAFDISVWQCLAAPLVGAQVHFIDDEIAQDPQALGLVLQTQKLSLWETVPGLLRAALNQWPDDFALPKLRWVLPTGEALPTVLARDWLQRYPQIPLMNAYGPAECSDDVAFYPILKPPALDERLPIGRPTANNQLFILDEQLRPQPIGVPGELCVAGVGVGRGYLQDPERTVAAFIEHPFRPGERFYRSGDLARYREDGQIEFLGRRDDQVKIRGQRMELGEIEAVLNQLPDIDEAAVVVQYIQGEGQLVAFVTPAQIDTHILQSELSKRLPAAMVPAQFQALEQLPRNANGKLDRKALQARQLDVVERVHEAPQTATEQDLAKIWAQVLNRPLAEIGRRDSFFALGGHSLLATQVAALIRRQGTEIALRALFEHPQLIALAKHWEALKVAAEGSDGQSLSIPALTVQPRPEKPPLSFAQQRLWFLEQLHPTAGLFSIPFALSLNGELDINALERAFQALIQRHEVLRTGFPSVAGEPWQQVHSSVPFVLEVVQSESNEQREAIVQHELDQLAAQPFDLQQPPLIRARVLLLAPQQQVLLVVVHHIAVDAWSIGLLLQELSQLYRPGHGAAAELAPPPLQYLDYSLWQQQLLSQGVARQQLHYWRQQLAQSSAELNLPGAHGPANGVLGRHRRHYPVSVLQPLQQLAEQQQASLFMVLQAALHALLWRWTGARDQNLGTDIANRHHAGVEGIVGFFVNQLVLRCRLDPALSFSELLAQCREQALAAYQAQDLPFEQLVAELLPQGQSRRHPFFNLKLIVQNTPAQRLELAGLDLEALALNQGAAQVDLLVNAHSDAAGLSLVFDYDRGRYPAALIEHFAECYGRLLQALPQQAARSLDLLCADYAAAGHTAASPAADRPVDQSSGPSGAPAPTTSPIPLRPGQVRRKRIAL